MELVNNRLFRNTYQIGELIGTGGFASVYRAVDQRTRRTVAIKLLHPHLARNRIVVTRFLREAALASKLREPHVVRVLASGEEGGTYYQVQEYVQGQTLAHLLRTRGPLPAAEAADYADQVLQALQAAHARGVVHRDIKPQNLSITSDGLLKIMDFGIAKEPGLVAMTRFGTYLGTPAYMSPEQTEGRPVDARSDLYSLGITLFELLAGRPPFRGQDDLDTLELQRRAPPPPLPPTVPPVLAATVYRALRKEPRRRFPSAGAMRRALSPVRGRARTGRVQAGSSRLPALLAAGLVVLTIVGVLVANGLASPPRSGQASAVQATVSRPTPPIAVPPTPPRPTPPPEAAARLAWEQLQPELNGPWVIQDWPWLIDRLEAFLRRYPDQAQAVDKLYGMRLFYAEALLKDGRLAEARDQLQVARALQPTRPEAPDRLLTLMPALPLASPRPVTPTRP